MSAHGLTEDFLQRAQHALGQDFLRHLFFLHKLQEIYLYDYFAYAIRFHESFFFYLFRKPLLQLKLALPQQEH